MEKQVSYVISLAKGKESLSEGGIFKLTDKELAMQISGIQMPQEQERGYIEALESEWSG